MVPRWINTGNLPLVRSTSEQRGIPGNIQGEQKRQNIALRTGRAQSIETMQLSPTFERNETTRKILGASSFVNSGGKVQGQSGLSDPRAFFWNNS